MKRVYLSTKESKLFGVCGGIGETYGLDPNVLRAAMIFLTLATAVIPMLAAYITAWLLIPSGRRV